MNYSSPSDIAKDFLRSAEAKLTPTFAQKIVYSLLGGAFIAIGGLLAIIVAGGMPGFQETNPGVVKFVFGAVFPVGLIMVVVAGAQLFTSDCAVLPFGLMARRISFSEVISNWVLVYLANFAGALAVVWMFSYQAELLSPEPWKGFINKLAVAKTSAPFMKVFIKGVGANWLVCLAVWMSYSAKDIPGKILAMWVPVMCFVALGMEHSIANMFFIPSAMILGADISITHFLVNNLLPSTLGNIAGGVIMVALPYAFLFPAKKRETFRVPSGGQVETLKDLEKRLN
jgi:formate transporter